MCDSVPFYPLPMMRCDCVDPCNDLPFPLLRFNFIPITLFITLLDYDRIYIYYRLGYVVLVLYRQFCVCLLWQSIAYYISVSACFVCGWLSSYQILPYLTTCCYRISFMCYMISACIVRTCIFIWYHVLWYHCSCYHMIASVIIVWFCSCLC